MKSALLYFWAALGTQLQHPAYGQAVCSRRRTR